MIWQYYAYPELLDFSIECLHFFVDAILFIGSHHDLPPSRGAFNFFNFLGRRIEKPVAVNDEYAVVLDQMNHVRKKLLNTGPRARILRLLQRHPDDLETPFEVRNRLTYAVPEIAVALDRVAALSI